MSGRNQRRSRATNANHSSIYNHTAGVVVEQHGDGLAALEPHVVLCSGQRTLDASRAGLLIVLRCRKANCKTREMRNSRGPAKCHCHNAALAAMAMRRAGQSLLPRIAQCNWQGFAPVAAGASPISGHDDTRERASVSGGLPAVYAGANLTRQQNDRAFAQSESALSACCGHTILLHPRQRPWCDATLSALQPASRPLWRPTQSPAQQRRPAWRPPSTPPRTRMSSSASRRVYFRCWVS